MRIRPAKKDRLSREPFRILRFDSLPWLSSRETVPAGKGRAEDPWYWAEEYGGVGGRESPNGYEYEINTNHGGLEKLKKDPRFKIVKTEPGKR